MLIIALIIAGGYLIVVLIITRIDYLDQCKEARLDGFCKGQLVKSFGFAFIITWCAIPPLLKKLLFWKKTSLI